MQMIRVKGKDNLKQNKNGQNLGGVEGYMPLENRLKEYRARLGINQSDLGKKAGVSRQTISLIEKRDYSPSVTLALKLAKIFQVKVEDIFSYVEGNEDDE